MSYCILIFFLLSIEFCIRWHFESQVRKTKHLIPTSLQLVKIILFNLCIIIYSLCSKDCLVGLQPSFLLTIYQIITTSKGEIYIRTFSIYITHLKEHAKVVKLTTQSISCCFSTLIKEPVTKP